MKVYLDMLGCRLNQSEIEKIAAGLIRQGVEVLSDPQEADLVIVNTCCVTAKASADSRKMIRKFRRETDADVLVTGCWASVFEAEAAELTEAGLVFPNTRKDSIVAHLAAQAGRVAAVTPAERKAELGSRSRTRSFIKVQDGCNNHCTYCLTRVARGEAVSVPINKVVRDIENAISQGVQEVVLTGVQIGSWGKDFQPRESLATLIEAVLAQTSVKRLRISSIEPWDIDEAFLDLWQDSRMCPHLHIPLQSGSDATLRRMARPGSSAAFAALIETVRARIPGALITTDIIVGFPGESHADFEDSYRFVEQTGFSGGHVFKFSPMPGTPAAGFPDQVQPLISHARSQKFRSLFKEATLRSKEALVGSVQSILWEHQARPEKLHTWSGFTPQYVRVETLSSRDLANTITDARIVALDKKGTLEAELVDAKEA